MPDNVTVERTQLLKMYKAEIVLSPVSRVPTAVAMALEMAEADSSYYMPYQYGNQANLDAHYNGTAVEIPVSSTRSPPSSRPGTGGTPWATPGASRRMIRTR